jgi:tRNA-dihydrouridine synthase
VIGNGDVQTGDDVVALQRHTGCAAVMIGRGSFGNPWIFRDARALLRGEARPPRPEAAERFATALEHAHLALQLQGDSRTTVVEFRKHLGWYTRGLPGAASLRERLFQVESMVEAGTLFQAYLERTAVTA